MTDFFSAVVCFARTGGEGLRNFSENVKKVFCCGGFWIHEVYSGYLFNKCAGGFMDESLQMVGTEVGPVNQKRLEMNFIPKLKIFFRAALFGGLSSFMLLTGSSFGVESRVVVLFEDGQPANSQEVAASVSQGSVSALTVRNLTADSAPDPRRESANIENQRSVLSKVMGLIRPIAGRDGGASALMKRLSGSSGASPLFPAPESADPLDRCRWNWGYLINGAALTIDRDDMETLRALPGVKAVYPDNIVKMCLSQSVPIMKADKVWEFRDTSGNPVNGSGVTVGIIDTGVDYTHPDLGSGLGSGYKVKGGYDYVNFDWNPFDDNGHGTHVAGIIAASGKVRGVAPGASIMAYKVLDSRGEGYSSDVVQAIQDAVKAGCDVVNISLGTTDDSVLTQTAVSAVRAGTVVCAAAGNEGPTTYTINSPGDGREVICVAACNKDLTIWSGSSRGPASNGELKPDITAPGKSIYSTYLNKNYAYLTGTSMATPHITGMCALLLQSAPELAPAQVKDRICNNAVDLGYLHTTQGYGLADCRAAVLNGTSAVPPTMTITVPSAEGVVGDSRVTLQWVDEDPDSSAAISLYYDLDRYGYDGTLIATAISEDSPENAYSWDTSSLPEGVYQIYYVITDGLNNPVMGYASGAVTVSHPPSIEVLLPLAGSIVTGSTLEIVWNDHDSDDDCAVTLWVDSDRINGDGVFVAGPFSEDADGLSFDSAVADLSGFQSGVWYVYGRIDDGKGNSTFAYAPGSVILNRPPTGFILFPDADITIAGGLVTAVFGFQDIDDSANAVLSFSGPSSGIIAQNIAEKEGLHEIQWNVSAIPSGEYRLILTVQDGFNTPLIIQSTGLVTINRPPVAVLKTPLETGAKSDILFYIGYSLSDYDSDARGEIFWSASADGSDPVSIAEAIPEGESSIPWDTSTLARGEYYIHMIAKDDLNSPVFVSAPGTVMVDHSPKMVFLAENNDAQVAGATLEVAFSISDDTGPLDIAFYLDSDRTGADGLYLGGAQELLNGEHRIVMPFGSSVRGEYWVYALLADGVNSPIVQYDERPVFYTPAVNLGEVRITNIEAAGFQILFSGSKGSLPAVEIRDSETGNPSTAGAQEIAPGLFSAAISGLAGGGTYFLKIRCSDNGFFEEYPVGSFLKVYTPSVSASDSAGVVRGKVLPGGRYRVLLSAFGAEQPAYIMGVSDIDGLFVLDLGDLYTIAGQKVLARAGMKMEVEVLSIDQAEISTQVKEVILPEISENSDPYDFDIGDFAPTEGFKAVIDIRRGWNLLSLPLEPLNLMLVSDFLRESNGLIAAKWDAEEQRYKTALLLDGALVGEDFELHAGVCIFLRASAEATVFIDGLKMDRAVARKFVRGYNFHGFARGGSYSGLFPYTYTSFGLLENLGIQGAAYSWDSITQRYHSAFVLSADSEALGENFNFSRVSGSIIKSDRAVYFLEDK